LKSEGSHGTSKIERKNQSLGDFKMENQGVQYPQRPSTAAKT